MLTELESRTADQDVAVDVDTMTLDYVTYMALAGCHSCTARDRITGIEQVITADASLHMFRARHGATTQLDPDVQLRFEILQLVALLTFRYSYNAMTPSASSIDDLRQRNRARAFEWIRGPDRLPSKDIANAAFDKFPLSDHALVKRREHVFRSLQLPREDQVSPEENFYGTSECVSLLDLLPFFMRISATASQRINARIEETWMTLAGEFMLQACLEQYFSFGADGLDAIDEAFAWGYVSSATPVSSPAAKQEGADDLEINAMFEDAIRKTEVEGWGAVKQAFMDKIWLGEEASSEEISCTPATASLEAAAADYPLALFEKHLSAFLFAMSNALPMPVLRQLERGQLTGMTKVETHAFLKDVCGWTDSELRDLKHANKGAT